MLTPQHILDLEEEISVDLFAGGGGLSTAYEMATGRHIDIAINHNDDAVSMHRMNHPQTRHFKADVFEVDPRTATRGRPVGFLHLSPDCTHHSQASGGQPRNGKIRALSWVGIRWAGQVHPRVITFENVKQILKWGPLIAKRDKATGRVVTLEMIPGPKGKKVNRIADPGERVPLHLQYLVPDPKRAGQTWRRFVTCFRALGYDMQWARMKADKHGAGTTRDRLYGVMRRDGEPIVFPQPSHAEKSGKGLKRRSVAADHLDFSLPCHSIFLSKVDARKKGVKRPLEENTLKRIAAGLRKYVLESADPFIVPATHADTSDRNRGIREGLPTITGANRGELMLAAPVLTKFRFDCDGQRLDKPLPVITAGGACKRDAAAAHAMGVTTAYLQQITQGGRTRDLRKGLPVVTTAKGGEQMLVAASMIQTGYGEREGQAPRTLDIREPLGAAVGTVKHSVVAAYLAQHNTMPGGAIHAGHDARDSLSAITGSGSQQGLVAASLVHLQNNCDARSVHDPLHVIHAGGEHHGVMAADLAAANAEAAKDHCGLTPEQESGALRVAAFLMRYHGSGGQWADLREPLTTMTAKDRLALVTVVVRGTPYVVVDIGLRMLTPRELYNCQGFPPNYIIDRGHDGRIFSKAKQVRMCGNSVSPPPAVALIRANYARPVHAVRKAA